jgi:hypothetical protein
MSGIKSRVQRIDAVIVRKIVPRDKSPARTFRIRVERTMSEPPARLTVDIDLEHHLGVIRRPTSQRWFDAFKPKLIQIKLIDKDINSAHGICVRHVGGCG